MKGSADADADEVTISWSKLAPAETSRVNVSTVPEVAETLTSPEKLARSSTSNRRAGEFGIP
jgi:hypothetical protein